MSKKVTVAGVKYDSRTIVENVERLKLPNHPKVNALAIPVKTGNHLTGKINIIVKIPFGLLEANVKEINLIITSPRRIDAISKIIDIIKQIPTYKRV